MTPVAQARWVTFDCYGTLVDWHGGLAAMLAPLAGARVDAVVRAYDACQRRAQRARPHRSFKDVLADALMSAGDDAGVRITAADVRELRHQWNAFRPFDDVEPMLAALRGRGYRLAVLTDCDDDLFEVTHRTFRRPFDLFVTGERIQGYKPAPWHFRAFEMLTRVERTNWVHVACSWYSDIAPAQAFGVQRVWLDRERSGEDATAASIHVGEAAAVVSAVEQLFDGCSMAV